MAAHQLFFTQEIPYFSIAICFTYRVEGCNLVLRSCNFPYWKPLKSVCPKKMAIKLSILNRENLSVQEPDRRLLLASNLKLSNFDGVLAARAENSIWFLVQQRVWMFEVSNIRTLCGSFQAIRHCNWMDSNLAYSLTSRLPGYRREGHISFCWVLTQQDMKLLPSFFAMSKARSSGDG